MSELANVNLEEGAEVVGGSLATPDPPAPEPVKEPEAPVAPPNPDEVDPEGTIEASGGVKFVPLDAVKAERARRKESEAKLKEKDTLVEQYRQKAEQFDQASQYLDQARPIIETLKQRPDLVALAKNPPPVKEPDGPLTKDEAEQYAKVLDLYTADGKLDIDRAQTAAKLNASLSQRQAAQAIAPFQHREAQQQSEHNRRTILNFKDAQGNAMVDPTALNTVWSAIDPAESAKPEVATTLYRLALGLMAEKGLTTKHTAPEPVVHSESIGGGKTSPQTLDHTGEAFLRASGQSRKDYMAIRESVKLNEPNVLE